MADLSRAEHIARAEKHPLLGVAEAHVAQLRAERAEARQVAATENAMEAIAAACDTALYVLGADAANTLTWGVKPTGMDAFVDLGGGLLLEYSIYPRGMAADDGPPGFLNLVRLCGECGFRWSKPVESLEKLAFLLEDMPKQTPLRRRPPGS